MIPPPYPSKGMDVLAWARRLHDYVMACRPVVGPGLASKETNTGTLISLAIQTSSSARAMGYPFAEIVTYDDDGSMLTGIRGGVVIAGAKTWNVPNKSLALSASGEQLFWLEVGITQNTYMASDGGDPPEETPMLSAGIADSEAPVWKNGSVEAGYPKMVPGTGENPDMTAVIPIGILKIDEGSASLTPAYYGSVELRFHSAAEFSQVRNGNPGGWTS